MGSNSKGLGGRQVAEPLPGSEEPGNTLLQAICQFARVLPHDQMMKLHRSVQSFADGHHGVLRVGTACSGSDGIMLVLRGVLQVLNKLFATKLTVAHMFSCEHIKWKQQWIQTVFPLPDGPRLIFHDITQLGDGAAVEIRSQLICDVPPVDLFVVGFSCKDASLLSSRRSKMQACIADKKGSTGVTAAGAVAYIRRFKPPFILMENVLGLGRSACSSGQDASECGDAEWPPSLGKRQRLNEQGQSHAHADSGGSQPNNTVVLLQVLQEVGYVAACCPVAADDFGSAAPRERLYFVGILQEYAADLSSRELHRALTETLSTIKLGPASVESCLEMNMEAADRSLVQWLLLSSRRDEEDSRCKWRTEHAKIFQECQQDMPPADLSCWSGFSSASKGFLSLREQDALRLLLLKHRPSDFTSDGGKPIVWAYDLLHSLARIHRRSPRGGKTKPLLTVLPRSNFFLMFGGNQGRLATPSEVCAFQGFFLDEWNITIRPLDTTKDRETQCKPMCFALTYREAVDLMGNAFNLFAAAAVVFAACFHLGNFTAPALRGHSCQQQDPVPQEVRHPETNQLLGCVDSAQRSALCRIHNNCGVSHSTHSSDPVAEGESLRNWLLAGSSFHTGFGHRAHWSYVLRRACGGA